MDLLLYFLVLVGVGGSLRLFVLFSMILLAWKKVKWEGEDLRWMLRKEFLEEMVNT